MNTAITFLSIVLVLGAVQGTSAQEIRGFAATPNFKPVQVLTADYVGDIQGAPALATVSFEQLRDYVSMSGQIQSGQFSYTFSAELVGASGFGEIVSHAEGTRFQIRIDLTPTGFALTSNPLGPGMPTTYYFTRK